MTVIVSSHPLHPDAEALVRNCGDLRVISDFRADALLETALDAEYIIVRAPLPEAFVAKAPSLKAIIRHGAGLDLIPVDAATKRGIMVANAPGANARTVAEHVLMVSLQLLRQSGRVEHQLYSQGWAEARALAEHANEISQKRIGIIGYGSVGKTVSDLFLAVGADVRAYSPRNSPPSHLSASIDGLFQSSDVLVLCCPLTAETENLIDAAALSRMKHGSFLINVARGGVVNDEALLHALDTQVIAGAALDVFDQQPLPAEHPYHNLPQVILTPHIAGLSGDAMRKMGITVANEIARIQSGLNPINFVNPEVTRPRAR